MLSVVNFSRRGPERAAALVPATPRPAVPTLTAVPASPTPRSDLPLVALLAGHSGGSDPGASCPDGLREVDVTTDVAQRAKAILEARGYRVDILAEFDSRLSAARRDYAPRAFLAIHADSCVKYASGYKVARAVGSAIPEEDDRLLRCVSTEYAASTLLPFHAGSVTNDMTQYHGLNEIDAKSPGAIIELGFLGSEHDLLQNRRSLLAEGVANGIDDFMHGNQCKKAEGSK
jgi:N-acetylmuramoyl-L-alanine amidase